jgi:hypothetical protein
MSKPHFYCKVSDVDEEDRYTAEAVPVYTKVPHETSQRN